MQHSTRSRHGFRNRLRTLTFAIANLFVVSSFEVKSQVFHDIGLVAHYRLDADTRDSSTNAIDGTMPDLTPATDRFGRTNRAIHFKGTGASTIKFESTRFDLQPPRTFSAWVRQTGGTEGPRIFSTSGYEMTSTVSSGSPAAITINTATSTGGDGLIVSSILPQNTWTHVVGVWTPTNGAVYVNGELVGSKTWDAQSVDFSRGFLPEIGGNSGNALDNFAGDMDDVRIYERALSELEIKSLFVYEGEPHLVPPRTAKAVANVVNGFVVGIEMIDGGSGYIFPPNIQFSGEVGSGAHAVATVENGGVTGITVVSAGAGYTSIPSLRIDAPPQDPRPARAAALVVNGFIVEFILIDGGAGYLEPPLVRISDETGLGAVITAQIVNGSVAGFIIENPGTDYGNSPVVRIARPPFDPNLEVRVSKITVDMNVRLGVTYLLESSHDLNTWTATGPVFVAEEERLSQEFLVSETGKYFRLRTP